MDKFNVGDEVRVPGFESPRIVLEIWRGKKQPRYLLGLPLIDIFTREQQEGMYKVDQLVDEDKLVKAYGPVAVLNPELP